MQKILIIIGLVILVIGLLWPWIEKSGLGRLPGDIIMKGENTAFYFPVVTCIIISVALSLVFWFLNK